MRRGAGEGKRQRDEHKRRERERESTRVSTLCWYLSIWAPEIRGISLQRLFPHPSVSLPISLHLPISPTLSPFITFPQSPKVIKCHHHNNIHPQSKQPASFLCFELPLCSLSVTSGCICLCFPDHRSSSQPEVQIPLVGNESMRRGVS